MKQFHETMRYDYPLTKESLVIDLGAHRGIFSAEISKQYGCRILAFEPITEFHVIADSVLSPYTNVVLTKTAVGPCQGSARFGVKGDMSGLYAWDALRTETVTMQSIDDVIPSNGCDLIKINIEGGEYDLLDHMIREGLTKKCRNIQVQFHDNVPNCEERRKSIREALLSTHRLTYDVPFCWENYERID